MAATDANANPVAVQAMGRVYATGTQFCAAVTSGGLAALSVPNPATSVPQGIYYTLKIKQGPETMQICPLVTVSGSTYDLDTFISANCTIASGSNGGPLYVNVTSPPFNAVGDGGVGIGSVSAGTLNQVAVTTAGQTTPVAGQAFWISEAAYGPPLLPNSNQCTNSGTGSYPACGGTGTLGNSTDTHVNLIIVEGGSVGSGQPSSEGSVLIAGGSCVGCSGVNVPSPAAVNGATTWKLYASIDPAFDGDHPAGISSGLEVLQTQCGSSGVINIGTACELDSITTGTAAFAEPTMFSTTISSVSGSTITLAGSLPNAVTGNQFSYFTPDDAAVTAAAAVLDANRGGTLFFPAEPGFYGFVTGLSFVGRPYIGLMGAGPASGVLQSPTNIQEGTPYTPSASSELATPAAIKLISITSTSPPHQQWNGPKIENLGFADVSGPACNGLGAIYLEDVNNFTIQNNGFDYWCKPGQTSISGESGGGGGSGFGIECDADALGVRSQCQYGHVMNNTGMMIANFFRVINGGSSEIVFDANRTNAALSGGNRGFIFSCNGGITSGGNNSIMRDTMVYMAISYDLCDQNADYIIGRSENTISATGNSMGHVNTGTGAWIHGSGAAGPNNTVSIQVPSVPGISESGSVVTVNCGVTSFPAAFGTPGNANLPEVNISNVPVNQYNGLWPMSALGPCASCGAGGASLAANQLQFDLCDVFGNCTTGLSSSGQGSATVSNTSQENTITGAMVNFDWALVIGPEAEATYCGALNLGPTNRNQFFDGGTDTQCKTNQGDIVQATSAYQPAQIIAPGEGATINNGACGSVVQQANGMCGPISEWFSDVARTQLGMSFDQFGNVNLTSPVAPVLQSAALPNSGTTYQYLLASAVLGHGINTTAAGSSIYQPLGICIANCGSSGSPDIAHAGSYTQLVMDNATTFQDAVTVSTTLNGAGHDAGAAGAGVAQVLDTAALVGAPSLNAITGTGTGTINGTKYFEAYCVNAAGGLSPISTETSVTFSTTGVVFSAPTCAGVGDVGWVPTAGNSSGGEKVQTITTTQCSTIVNGVHVLAPSQATACPIGSNWVSGSLGTGTTIPTLNTDGPLVHVWVTTP